MLFLFSLNSEEQIKIGNETKDYNLSKLPQTTSEGQDIKRLEGDKQLVIELNINKNGISNHGERHNFTTFKKHDDKRTMP